MKTLIPLFFAGLFWVCCPGSLRAQCPPLVATGDQMEGPTEVCKNEITYYIAPEVENATFYLFSLSTGQSAQTDIPEIDVEWLASLEDTTYTLCISAFNDCEMLTDYACLDIEFRHAVALNIEMTLCPGEVFEAFGNVYEAPGEYNYESFNQVGCDSFVSIVLEEYAPMDVSADITNDAGSCNGSIELTVLGAPPFNYAWSHGGIPSGLCAGFYTVTVTDANGCTGEFEFEVTLGTATSSLQQVYFLPVFPNPAGINQALSIQPGDLVIRSVEYLDLQGQSILKSESFTTNDQRMTLPGIALPGMYVVRMVDDEGKVFVGKILVVNRDQ